MAFRRKGRQVWSCIAVVPGGMMTNGNHEQSWFMYIDSKTSSVSTGWESSLRTGARQIHVGGATEVNLDGKSSWISSLSPFCGVSDERFSRSCSFLDSSVSLLVLVVDRLARMDWAAEVPSGVAFSKSTRLSSFSSSNAVRLF